MQETATKLTTNNAHFVFRALAVPAIFVRADPCNGVLMNKPHPEIEAFSCRSLHDALTLRTRFAGELEKRFLSSF